MKAGKMAQWTKELEAKPEFNPQNPHGREKECQLLELSSIFRHLPLHALTHTLTTTMITN